MFCARFMVCLLLVVGLSGCMAEIHQQQKEAQQADVHYKMGLAHLQGNNPTQALKELLIAVENGPENSGIHASLAQAYQIKKAYNLAEQHYLRALVLSGNDPSYQNNLASLYIDMERWDKAIDYFDKAAGNLLFMNPHVALTGKGYVYLKKQNFPVALQQFKKAIAIAPRYARAYYLQNEAYQALGQMEMARLSLEQAVEVAPGFVQALYQLGIIALKEQQPTAAVKRFERVVELAPASDWGMKSSEMLRALKRSANDNATEG